MDSTEIELAAGAISAAAGVAKPAVEVGGRLIGSLLGKPCKVAGAMIADQVYAWQWANRCRIAERAQKIMAKNGTAAKVVPPGFLLPLIEAAGNVDEPDLQELWAQLLANGVAHPDTQHPAYIEALRRMNVDDAALLRNLSTAPVEVFKVKRSADLDAPLGRLLALGMVERVSGQATGRVIGGDKVVSSIEFGRL